MWRQHIESRPPHAVYSNSDTVKNSIITSETLIETFSYHIDELLTWLDYAGVAVFAVSGALVASRKCLDPVGFALIATVTGIGGGTLRDLLLSQKVFWIFQPNYVALCVSLAAIVYIAAPRIEYRYRLLLWADAAGLSLFCVLGARLTVESGFSGTIAIVMGLLSATFGGLIRDVLCNEIPLILRNEIYATAALFGALVFVLIEPLALPYGSAELAGVCACFMVRAFGLSRGLSLPRYRPRMGREYPNTD